MRGTDLARGFVALALILAPAGCGSESPVVGAGAGLSVAAAPDDPVVFGSVPDFELVSQLGETVTAASLAGRPYVVAAVFTTCVGPCPRIAAEMQGLARELEGTDAMLVSISVDPGYDSPEILAEYADALGADADRWLFLTGPEDEVYGLVREGFKLGVARAGEDAPFGLQVTHGTKLVAVDREGAIRGWYESQTDEGVAALLARMLHLASQP